MAYKTNSDMKGERKRGMDAMRAMVAAPGFDPQAALALAQRNLDAFGKIDDLDNAKFVAYMNDMRLNHPNLYPIFWWWRDAEEKAGRRQETDSDQPESRFRSFMITQFLAPPFSADWEDDRRTLKPGVEPWITEEKIAEGLDHKTIKRWAWVWHDRDIYTEADEIADRNGQVKTGELKFKHVHIMLDIPAKVPISTVARWFGVPPQQVTVMRGRGAFMDGVEYLPHESPRAVEQHKTHYDDDEIHASPGFDFRKELADLQRHRARYGKRAGEMTPADTMRMHVLHDGWTMKQCRDDDPLTYSHIKSTLPPLRLDYLIDAPPCPFRINLYIDAGGGRIRGGVGKTSLCEYIAEAQFPASEDPFFTIGNDERVTFDGYDGQPVIIWDDMRAVDFIKQFGRNGTFRLLDPHPKKIAQQAKHSRVILCNTMNIINGVEPYEQFINGLAGTYIDQGGVQHEAEDDTQAWRRIPVILRVTEDEFTIWLNKGFVDDDLSSIKTMYMYSMVRANMKGIMRKLDAKAKYRALLPVGKAVQGALETVKTAHDDKISDPDQIPQELMPHIEYQAASMEQAVHDAQARKEAEELEAAIEEAEQIEMARTDAIIEFACWFWSSTVGGFAGYLEEHPEELDSAKAEFGFAQDDALLKKAIKGCLRYFRGSSLPVETRRGVVYHDAGDLVGARPLRMDMILGAVKLAWEGYFGDVPPLTKDSGYTAWKARIVEKERGEGHKYCSSCNKIFRSDAKFCSGCGQPLPDKIIYDSMGFAPARIQLAKERGCDPADVPDEDVKARYYHADGYEYY